MGDNFGSDGGSQNVAKDHGTAYQTNVNYGISPELFAEYVKKLAVTESALSNFFKILEQKQVPPEELDSRLREIAAQAKQQSQYRANRSVDLDIIPYPIATAFRRIKACHQQDAKRLKNILQVAEMATRFFAIAALSEVCERVVGKDAHAPASLARPVQNLNRPSFGHWLEILREATRFLAEFDFMFMPELRDFVFAAKISSPSRNMQMINEILTVRNRFAHGDMQPAEIRNSCDECEHMIKELLQNMQFLESYFPYYVRQVSVRRRRHSDTKFSHQFWRLSGPYQDPEAVLIERDWHTDTDDIILENSGGNFINLQPLYLYIDSEKYYSSSKIRPDLYVLNGFKRNKDGINISYHPCGTSGKAFKSFELQDTEEQELLSKGIQEYLDSFIS